MWYGVATLVGTIIGVGIFGLPYAAARSGFFVQLSYLGIFAIIFTLLHLMFGEVMLRTTQRYRLSGYIGLYFGEGAKKIILAITIISFFGGMLAYILVGGSFLRALTGGIFGSLSAYYIIFWAAMSIVVALGLSMIKRAEIVMLAFMIAIVALIFFFSIPHVQWDYFMKNNWGDIFFPYGITMFALAGVSAIPAVREIMRGDERKMKKAIIMGTLIPVALYTVFVFAVLGVAGSATSEDAFSGLHGILGAFVESAGAVFGILAVATSYIIFGLYLRDTLWYDFNIPRKVAIGVVVMAPIMMALAYPGSYIAVIGFLGAVGGGLEAMFVIAAFIRVKRKGDRVPEYALSLPALVPHALILLFALGIGYTLLVGGQ